MKKIASVDEFDRGNLRVGECASHPRWQLIEQRLAL